MADIIHLLPDSVANQIAAGEVVMRPASVVKELMENAVDAGATVIDVWITDAGKTSIQVSDNGKGMSETDARLAFERHATSKILHPTDLFNLHTMGFRGEALAAISSVSQVELKTRTADDEMGTQISLSGSRVVDQHPIAYSVGTCFTVSNLFFNIPARRRFLKSEQTEFNNIMAQFERVALIHPEIAFTLHRDGTRVMDLRASSFRRRIVAMFGASLDKQLLPVSVETRIVNLTGFIGTPQSAKTKGARQFFFVNNRYMRHPYFNRAVVNAAERLIPADKQLPYFLCLTVDPQKIDVNIDPTKTEIKFEDEQAIWQIIQAACREALGRHGAAPTIDFTPTNLPEMPAFNPELRTTLPTVSIDPSYNPFSSSAAAGGGARRASVPSSGSWQRLYEGLQRPSLPSDDVLPPELPETPTLYADQTPAERQSWTGEQVRFMQHANRYVLCSAPAGLMVVDQQRAAVNIAYHQFMNALRQRNGVSQGLLFKEPLQLPPDDVDTFNNLIEDFRAVGFDIVYLCDGEYEVCGVPAGTEDQTSVDLLMDIYQDVVDGGTFDPDKVYHRIALSLAHRHAGNRPAFLSPDDMRTLVDALMTLPSPAVTPDGKPVYILMPDERLGALFASK